MVDDRNALANSFRFVEWRKGKTFLDVQGIIDKWDHGVTLKKFAYKCIRDDGANLLFENLSGSKRYPPPSNMQLLVDITDMDADKIKKYYRLARAIGAAGINEKIFLRNGEYGDFFENKGKLFAKFKRCGCLEAVNDYIKSGHSTKIVPIIRAMEDYLQGKKNAVAVDERVGKTFLDMRDTANWWCCTSPKKEFILNVCDDGHHVFFKRLTGSREQTPRDDWVLLDITDMDENTIEKYYRLARACGAAGMGKMIFSRSSKDEGLFPDFFEKKGYILTKFKQFPACLESVNEYIESGEQEKLENIRKVMEGRSFLEEKTAAGSPAVIQGGAGMKEAHPGRESGAKLETLESLPGFFDERIGKTFLDARGIVGKWNGYITQKDFIYKCTCDDGVHVFFEKQDKSRYTQDIMWNLVDVTGMDAGEIEKYYRLARACGAAGINTKISLRSSNYGELFPDFFKKRGYLFEKFTQYPGCLEAVNECIESGNAAKLWDIKKIMEDRHFLEEKTAAVAPLVSRSRRETEKHTPQAGSGGQNMVNIMEGWAPTSFQPERLKTKPHQTEDAQSSMTASDMLKDLQKLSNLGGFRAFCKTLLAETELLIRGQTEPLQDLVIKIGSYLVAPDSQRYPLFVSGPTGCGKTYSVKTLCGKMGIPFVEIATPDLSPASYKGTTIQDVIYDAVSAVSGDEGRPERMIVYLDEFGKILDRGGRDRSLSHEIQNGFLKLVEPGAKAKSDRRHEGIKEVDLKDVLIILSDALSSMEGEVSRAKLIEAGFIPELAGRIQLVQPFRQLTAEDYLDILENAKGTTLESKAKALAAIGLRLGITPEAKWELARMAAQDKGGARALGHMVNNVIEAELKDKVFLSRDGDPNLRISPEVVRRRLQKDNGRDLKQAIRVCK